MNLEIWHPENGRRDKLEVDVVTALSNPLYQGFFHFGNNDMKNEIGLFDESWRASNFGLVYGSAGMTIIETGEKNYKIIHLTDNPFMCETRERKNRCPFKLSDGGRHFHVKADVGEVINYLSENGYSPQELPEYTELIKLTNKLNNEMQKNITRRFVDNINLERYHGRFSGNLVELEKEVRDILYARIP